jgi:hypothetical protein
MNGSPGTKVTSIWFTAVLGSIPFNISAAAALKALRASDYLDDMLPSITRTSYFSTFPSSKDTIFYPII